MGQINSPIAGYLCDYIVKHAVAIDEVFTVIKLTKTAIIIISYPADKAVH